MFKVSILTGQTTSYQKILLQQIILSAKIPPQEVYISEVNPAPCNILIIMGNESLVFYSKESLEHVRGTVLTSYKGDKILPTYHLQRVVEDWSLLTIVISDFIKACKEKDFPEVITPKWNFNLNPSFSEVIDYLEFCSHQDHVCFDLETSIKTRCISKLGLAHSSLDGMSIPISANNFSHWSIDQEVALWDAISEFFRSPTKKIAHNACFDVAVLWHENRIWTENLWFDTMIAWHILYPEFEKNLGFVASMVLNVPAWKHTSGEDLALYNVMDVCNTLSIAIELEKEINNKHLNSIFNHEMSQVLPSIFLSLRGIKLDNKRREEIKQSIDKELSEVELNLSEILKKDYSIIEPINYRSPKQLKELLYIKMGLPVQVKRGSGTVTTDEKAIDKLYRKTQNKVLYLMMKHRELSKLTTYCNIELSPEGRVNTSYNITGTTSGRWSSSESIILPFGSGNLQNIPSGGYGSIIRSMYVVSDPDKYIVQADFVQAEAVIIAYLIEDEILIENFKNPSFDLHKFTASLMFEVKLDEVTPEQREIGKKIRHATNYSLGANGLADVLKCESAVAKGYLKAFHESCPQLARWQNKIQSILKATRILTNPLGRVRKFYGRMDDATFRSAYSYIPQSTIGDLLNLSLVKFYNLYGNEYSLLLQLHDAIYIDNVSEDKTYDCITKLRECMTHNLVINNRTCVIKVDFKRGKNWKDMEKIK